jgi:hypothetical protein
MFHHWQVKKKGKVIPLHIMDALEVRGGFAHILNLGTTWG